MDSIILTGPAGSSIQIGSWLDLPNGGADYGAKDLIRAQFVDNPYTEGELAFEDVGVRHMSFPLLLNTKAVASLTQVESVLRQFARPGAVVSVQTETTPTAEAVQFDVLTGRWEPGYDTYLNRVDRRKGTLFLDTKPYGYWPTQILLASVASMAFPGTIRITPASIIGDAPAWGRLAVGAFTPTQYAVVPTVSPWVTDFLAWSLAGGPSVPAFIDVATWNGIFNPATQNGADVFAPQGRNTVMQMHPTLQWNETQAVYFSPASSLLAGYRGRFRLFGWFRHGPSGLPPYYVTADVGPGGAALASAAPVATLLPAVSSVGPSGVGAYGAQPSPMYQMLDLGEVTFPRSGSGPFAQMDRLRIWFSPPSGATITGTAMIAFGGAMLLPVDGAAGIMPRGVAQPTVSSIFPTRDGAYDLALDAQSRQIAIRQDSFISNGIDDTSPAFDNALRYYSGNLPMLGASTNQLILVAGVRRGNVAVTGPIAHPGSAARGAATLYYTPRFQFLKGL